MARDWYRVRVRDYGLVTGIGLELGLGLGLGFV